MPCGYGRRSRAADGVAAMSRFRLVWECAGRRRLRQAEPCCGRGCRVVMVGGAALRTGGTSARQSQPVDVQRRVPTRATWENGAVPTKAVVLEGDFAVVR